MFIFCSLLSLITSIHWTYLFFNLLCFFCLSFMILLACFKFTNVGWPFRVKGGIRILPVFFGYISKLLISLRKEFFFEITLLRTRLFHLITIRGGTGGGGISRSSSKSKKYCELMFAMFLILLVGVVLCRLGVKLVKSFIPSLSVLSYLEKKLVC